MATSVVKVHVLEHDWCWQQPTKSCVGDGMVVGTAVCVRPNDVGLPLPDQGKAILLTNFHVVEDSGPQRSCQLEVGDRLIDAEAKFVIPALDIAVLQTASAAPKELVPVRVSRRKSLPIGTAVTAMGFALDCASVFVSRGTVTSKISSIESGFLSHTASISSGCSGGPLLHGSGSAQALVGINSATMVECEACSLAVPSYAIAESIQRYCACPGAPVVARLPQLGLELRPRHASEVKAGLHGVRVIRQLAHSAFAPGALRQEDVITALNGHAIRGVSGSVDVEGCAYNLLDDTDAGNDDGTVMPLLWLPMRLVATVVREGREIKVSTVQRCRAEPGMSGTVYPYFDPKCPYTCLGGATIQPLNRGLFESYDEELTNSYRDCLRVLDESRERRDAPGALVITHVEAGSAFRKYVTDTPARITRVNGHAVHTLQDMARCLGPQATPPRATVRTRKRARDDASSAACEVCVETAADGPVRMPIEQLERESAARSTSFERVSMRGVLLQQTPDTGGLDS